MVNSHKESQDYRSDVSNRSSSTKITLPSPGWSMVDSSQESLGDWR
jgi:hypothetical protein